MVRESVIEMDSLSNSIEWTSEQQADTLRSLYGEFKQTQNLSGVETMVVNRNSVFMAAFWTGLASPVSVYAASPTYFAYMGNYSVPLNFVQVGLALSHSYSPLVNDGQSLDIESGNASINA